MTLQLDRPWAAAQSPAVRPDTVGIDILNRWYAGQDTAEIAAATRIAQADICRIIAADQDRRHALRTSESGA